VDINARNNRENTPFHNAALERNWEVAAVLLGNGGVDVNAKNDDGLTVLHIAATNEDINLIKLIAGVTGVDANATVGVLLSCRIFKY
jgi:ankyrin repeat protein